MREGGRMAALSFVAHRAFIFKPEVNKLIHSELPNENTPTEINSPKNQMRTSSEYNCYLVHFPTITPQHPFPLYGLMERTAESLRLPGGGNSLQVRVWGQH